MLDLSGGCGLNSKDKIFEISIGEVLKKDLPVSGCIGSEVRRPGGGGGTTIYGLYRYVPL